ncbi:MAG: hypothetical protein V7K30_07570 [Nostoc sp.]
MSTITEWFVACKPEHLCLQAATASTSARKSKVKSIVFQAFAPFGMVCLFPP